METGQSPSVRCLCCTYTSASAQAGLWVRQHDRSSVACTGLLSIYKDSQCPSSTHSNKMQTDTKQYSRRTGCITIHTHTHSRLWHCTIKLLQIKQHVSVSTHFLQEHRRASNESGWHLYTCSVPEHNGHLIDQRVNSLSHSGCSSSGTAP